VNLLSFALGNLRHRPVRSSLTVSAIALGIAAVVALTSIAWGFEASWQKANDVGGTDLIVTRIASENAMPSPFSAAKVQQALKGYPHVQEVVGQLTEMLSVSDDVPPVFVFGWTYGSYLWKHLKLVDGRWPRNDTDPEVMIGALAAEMLHEKIGESIEIEGRQFRVSGIFESSAVVENGSLMMTLTQAQQINDKPGKVNVLTVKLDRQAADADIDDFKARVRETMPGFVAITSGELVSKNTVVRISKAMSNATILIAALVGALVVFNTMLMSISERTREIGILLTVGWQRRTIMKLVLCESVILTLAGGFIGILMGISITWSLEHLDLLRGKIDAVFSAPFLMAVLGLSVLLGIGGGLYPALKASRLLPAHALWQE
jgi:putative ABC transport system permease protein